LHNLLRTNLGLGSPTAEVRSYEGFDVRTEAPIPLGHNFHDDTHCYDLKEASNPSSPLAATPSLEFSIVSDTLKGTLTIHDLSLLQTPLGEPEEGDRF